MSLRSASWRICAVVRERGLREHFVVPVDRERAVLVDRGLEEVEQVARVHLARVVRRAMRGRLTGPTMRTPFVVDGLAGARQLAVAAALGGKVDDHGAGLHALDRCACVMIRGAGRPGTAGRGDHAVGGGDARVEHVLLLRLLLGRQLARVAAGALGA